jgi:hypothetical protein
LRRLLSVLDLQKVALFKIKPFPATITLPGIVPEDGEEPPFQKLFSANPTGFGTAAIWAEYKLRD